MEANFPGLDSERIENLAIGSCVAYRPPIHAAADCHAGDAAT